MRRTAGRDLDRPCLVGRVGAGEEARSEGTDACIADLAQADRSRTPELARDSCVPGRPRAFRLLGALERQDTRPGSTRSPLAPTPHRSSSSVRALRAHGGASGRLELLGLRWDSTGTRRREEGISSTIAARSAAHVRRVDGRRPRSCFRSGRPRALARLRRGGYAEPHGADRALARVREPQLSRSPSSDGSGLSPGTESDAWYGSAADLSSRRTASCVGLGHLRRSSSRGRSTSSDRSPCSSKAVGSSWSPDGEALVRRRRLGPGPTAREEPRLRSSRSDTPSSAFARDAGSPSMVDASPSPCVSTPMSWRRRRCLTARVCGSSPRSADH